VVESIILAVKIGNAGSRVVGSRIVGARVKDIAMAKIVIGPLQAIARQIDIDEDSVCAAEARTA
jgi:hypothetical protein